MLKIYNICNKIEYLKEVLLLCHYEWGKNIASKEELNKKINIKIDTVKYSLENPNFCILVLLDNKELIGFISIFPHDCDEREDLTPWYATMYVKKEYRGNGYSKILNDALLKEARKRNFEKIYLKTDLIGYYEKFGAKYLDKLNNGEKLYYFDLR